MHLEFFFPDVLPNISKRMCLNDRVTAPTLKYQTQTAYSSHAWQCLHTFALLYLVISYLFAYTIFYTKEDIVVNEHREKMQT